MIGLSAFKDIYTTADAENYLEMYEHSDDSFVALTTEPTYVLLSRVLSALGCGVVILFLIYALLSIPTKIWAINKLTEYIFTALIIYIPIYFPLHDIVQIRAGAAAACIMLCVYFLCSKRKGLAILLFVAGILFHYSCLVFLPVLFVGNRNLSIYGRVALFSVIPIGFMMYFMNVDLLSFLPSSLVGGKVDFYKEMAEKGEHWADYILPYKNLYLLSKCALLSVGLYFYRTIISKTPCANIVFVMLAASIFMNLSLTRIPVLAGRLGDLYGITDCIAFTYMLYIIRPKWVVRLGIFLLGAYMLVFNYRFAGFVV